MANDNVNYKIRLKMVLISILVGIFVFALILFQSAPVNYKYITVSGYFIIPLGITQLIFLILSYRWKSIKVLENSLLLFLTVTAYFLFLFNFFIVLFFVLISGGADINIH